MNAKDRAVRNTAVAIMSSRGKSQREIAKEVGMTQQNVCLILDKEASRLIIEQETSKLVARLPEITESLIAELKMDSDLTKHLADPANNKNETLLQDVDDILKFKGLAEKKSSAVLRATGIYQSQGTNIFVQNIVNDNRKQILTPEVFRALGGLFNNEEIIDVEAGDG